jgi:hypothetical protein
MFDNIRLKLLLLAFLVLLPVKVASPHLLYNPELFVSGENTLILVSGYFYTPQTLGTLISENRGDLERFIGLVRFYYPQYETGLTKLARCESSGIHENRWGDNYHSYGLLQFQKRTFYNYCSGDWQDMLDQLHCSVRMIEKGLGPTTQGWYNCWRKENLWRYF